MAATRYSAPALEKGLDILELLAGEEDGLTQNEVALRLGRTAGQIFRMLEVLARRDYIRRSTLDGRYRLSLRVFELGHRHPPIRRLLEAALAEMRRFAEDTSQSAHICVYFDRRLVVIARAEGAGPLDFGVRLGAHFPFRPDRVSAKILSAFEDPGGLTPMRSEMMQGLGADLRQRLDAQLRLIRRKGYAREPSTTTFGVTEIGHPVFDASGTVIASLAVPYLRMRDNPTGIEATRRRAGEAATAISRRLGAEPAKQRKL